MILVLSKGCTRSLDVAIAEARIRYAAEHLNFHQIFGHDTVPDLQRVLRGEADLTLTGRKRDEVVVRILRAQRKTPHTLWTLLLLQAFEPLLVRRHRRLGGSPEVDARIVETFLAALVDLPASLCRSELAPFVVRASSRALFAAMRSKASAIPAAPESGVRLCTASTAAREVTP